jgi:hypothetical protein
MRLHHRPLALFITLALLAITHAGGARAQCDSSYARLSAQGNERVYAGVAAAQELVYADSLHREYPGYPDYVVNGSGFVRVDLAARSFAASSHSDASLYFAATARDEYRVVGMPGGAEVTIRIRVTGTFDHWFSPYTCAGSGCSCEAGLRLQSGVSDHLEVMRLLYSPDRTETFDTSVDIVRRVGEPFMISYDAVAGTSHIPAYVSFTAQVAFEGLPPGLEVVSCLEDHLTTESRTGTWGSLKVRYQ